MLNNQTFLEMTYIFLTILIIFLISFTALMQLLYFDKHIYIHYNAYFFYCSKRVFDIRFYYSSLVKYFFSDKWWYEKKSIYHLLYSKSKYLFCTFPFKKSISNNIFISFLFLCLKYIFNSMNHI